MRARHLIAASVFAVVWSSSALAGLVRMTDASLPYLDGVDGTGGAFTATQLSGYNGENGGPGGGVSSFSTFCIERNETISFGSNYYTQITTGAINGGIAGGNPDIISSATALLYRTFRDSGLINGTSIDNSTKTSDLQHAIWYLEDEMALGSLSAAAQGFVTWAQTNAVAGELYGVRVLNLYNSYDPLTGIYSQNAQDMLTIVPLPDAGWMGIGLLGSVAGYSYLRRRVSAS